MQQKWVCICLGSLWVDAFTHSGISATSVQANVSVTLYDVTILHDIDDSNISEVENNIL